MSTAQTKESLTWKIGGEAGFGIISSGTMLGRVFTRIGYHVLVTNEYPSLIRGGHNLITLRVATHEFQSLNQDIHILVALNKETIELHKSELQDGTLLVFDPSDYAFVPSDFVSKVIPIELPVKDIIKRLGVETIMRNTIAIGATLALVGIEFDCLVQVIRDQFQKKGQEIINHNIKVAQTGYDYIRQQYASEHSLMLDKVKSDEPKLLLNASEAVGIGAVKAGLKFAAIYPMTPINSLITFLADHARELGIVYKQPEDEIAGINMAIGASLAGVRSMVATSGGGFALMVEGLSLAGAIEVPVVIDMGMRVGPATGMPTWTEQGELLFIIRAGHGEFARIVLAPADASQAYELTIKAFNLADKYQCPVFILTDKYINESQWCVPKAIFDQEVVIDRGKLMLGKSISDTGTYKRYDLVSEDGVSERSVPGMKNGFYIANSYEHDEMGYVAEAPQMRAAMAAKRLRKLQAIDKDVLPPDVYGDEQAQTAVLCWGSTGGSVVDAFTSLGYSLNGQKVKVLHFSWMYPFPTESVKKLLTGMSRIIDIEQNGTGQLALLLREHTGIEATDKVLKFDGRPFYPEEIIERI